MLVCRKNRCIWQTFLGGRIAPAPSAVLRAARDSLRDIYGDSDVPRNSKRVVYFKFLAAVSERSESKGEVAEWPKAAVC